MDYGASNIVAKDGESTAQGDGTDVSVAAKDRVISDQGLATNVPVGKRLPSVKVLSQSDARPWHLQELLRSNGRWRVIVFPGDVTDSTQVSKLAKVGKVFHDESSFLRRFTPQGGRYDDVFEVLAVHKAPRTSVTIFDFPEAFREYDETDGWDYNKIYVDDISYHEGHGNLYHEFGISPAGCILIARPDQYVSYIGPLDEPETVNKFFAGFMRESKAMVNGNSNGVSK